MPARPPPPTRRPLAGSRPADGDPRRSLGKLGEELAAAHLRALGFEIVQRNARTRAGEIDIIAFDAQTLVFISMR